jgi:hypothetical protein
MSRRHPKRKTSSGRFAMIPLAVFQHVAVQTLTHAMFRVLISLAAAFNGHNNGALGVTAAQAKESGGISRATLYGALRELESRGLIEKTFEASRVPPRPTMYALSWLAINDTDYSKATPRPSHAYRDWKPRREAA